MNINLDRWHAQYILEGLQTLDEKCTAIIQSTEDEDVMSEYANDIAQLKILHERFEALAVEEFGRKVTNFSRQTYVSAGSKVEVAART